MANVYARGERLRLLDWGDASISHPFASLVVTFRFLEERNGLPPGDPWFARLRDVYLEPWGRGLAGVFALAFRVGTFAHTFAWMRQRDHLPEEARPEFDRRFPSVLRRAVAQTSNRRPTAPFESNRLDTVGAAPGESALACCKRGAKDHLT